MKTILLSILLFSNISINYSQLALIESNNNPLAFNKISKAAGKFQITPICLKEYNQYHDEKYKISDLFDADINEKIAVYYLEKRIPELLHFYELDDTLENRLIAYNWGIKNLALYKQGKKKLPEETKEYLRRYENEL